MAYTDRFADSFTETTDTNLVSHTPDTGSGWTQIGPGTGGQLVVDSATDSVDHPFGGGSTEQQGWTADWGTAYASDQQAEADHLDLCSNHVMLGTRIQSDGVDSADGYAGWHDGGANQWRITRIDSGSATNLGNFFDNADAASDVIILQSEGTTHKLFENGTERISVSDSTYSSGGSPGLFGIRTFDGNGPDNFVGRDQAAAGDTLVPQQTTSISRRVTMVGY